MIEGMNWNEKYPQMPETFHLAIREVVEVYGDLSGIEEKNESGKSEIGRNEIRKSEVERNEIERSENRQNETEKSEMKKIESEKEFSEADISKLLKKREQNPPVVLKKNWKKLYVWGIAATLTFGLVGGVTAAQILKEKEFRLEKYLGFESRKGLEDLFYTDIEVTIPDEAMLPLGIKNIDDKEAEEYLSWWKSEQKERENNKPLIEIQEVMFDGMELVVYATTTDEGEKYELWTDTMNIEGERILLEHGGKIGKGRECIFQTHIRGIEYEDSLEIVLPLGVYKNGTRYENQDYVFEITGNNEMIELPEQEFVFDNCMVKVSEMVKSRIAIMGKIEVFMSEEQKEIYENDHKQMVCMAEFRSADGEEWEQMNVLETDAYRVLMESEKSAAYFHKRMPEPDSQSVIVDVLIAMKESQYEEPVNMYDAENIWVKGIEVSLEEEKLLFQTK